ncbi:vacuolar protein sorting-associated protein 33B-like [Ruditapes philippinarum]|uniref:vacuolar protein sorting-associated protein 33B-like n=1 Tax=Ruditapes philippinarum TaxID=129788 RepID=UPI00295BB4B5|nr:vacuolar protein sorting-associated protein 33B-like [Ruditapes philippinarum]
MAAAGNEKFPDMTRLNKKSRQDIERCLNEFQGRKDLVLDPDLMKPLDRITGGAAFLKDNGVDKIFKLDRADKQIKLVGCDRRVYLVRPKINIMKIIADHISSEQSRGENRKYRIVMVPRRLFLCEMILEQEGVLGHCDLDEVDLNLLPLDTDILSMETPEFFKSFYLDSDLTLLQTVSKSVHTIQGITGEIPNVYCLGRAGKMCYELLKQMTGERLIQPDYPRSEIGHLFLIDRGVDFVTPLCSQVTYEGLLDDMFGIQCGCVEFGKDITQKDQPVKVRLNSEDEMYEAIRCRHFTNVFDFLKSKAQDLQSLSDKRKEFTKVKDMKDFVANDLRKLNQSKANLTYHIGACEQIIQKKNKGDFVEYMQTEHSLLEGTALRENLNYIEESINKQNSLMSNLKLMCLTSLTNDGIPARDYKSLKTQFVQSHGFEQLITFHNLKKVGLLREQEVSSQSRVSAGVAALTRNSSFKNIRKRLNLIPSVDVDLRSPCDMSYVFSGAYAPLSCKLVEQVLQREGFSGMEEITKHIPGSVHADVKLRTPGKGIKGMTNQPGRPAPVVLVYFIGGCTYSEIAALRFLGKQQGYKFIVATTSLFNGNSMLNTVIEKSPL